MLNYPAALISFYDEENNQLPYGKAMYYFAVAGNMDDVDIIALRSFSGNPLAKKHLDPIVCATIYSNLEKFKSICNFLENNNYYLVYSYQYSTNDGFTVFKVGEEDVLLRAFPRKDGWVIDKDSYGVFNSIISQDSNTVSLGKDSDLVKDGSRLIDVAWEFLHDNYGAFEE